MNAWLSVPPGSRNLEQFSRAEQSEDYAAMQGALTRMREGLDLIESGEAARKALAEPGSTRAAALQWFKREMDLLPRSESADHGGVFGL